MSAPVRTEQATGTDREQTGGPLHASQIFWHGWHPWQREYLSHDVRGGAQGGHGRRQAVHQRLLSPSRGDRQGYAALGLHDRIRAGLRLHRRGHGRVPARPDADAGRRHADPLAPRRSRRDDLGLAQSVRRQRHQAVRSGRLQALRREGGGDRAADGGRLRGAAGGAGEDRPGHPHRQRARALYRIRQAHAAEEHPLRRHQGGDRLRQRRGLQSGARGAVGARRRGHQDRRRAERLEHQQGLRLDRARGSDPQGQRGARRYRHRARRRRRPRGDRRREGPHHRRRPADGGDRRSPGRSAGGSPAAASSPR